MSNFQPHVDNELQTLLETTLFKQIEEKDAEIVRLKEKNLRLIATYNDYNAGWNDAIKMAEKQFAQRSSRKDVLIAEMANALELPFEERTDLSDLIHNARQEAKL